MSIRVNPKYIDELVAYGAEDVQLCYHCGDCSTVCPHADNVYKFPRKSMRLLQMGLNRKIETTLEPWLCYYCGQCSEQCPREADPGETMMSLRRWLIGKYDFTGIAKQFFKSKTTEILTVIGIAIITGILLLLKGFSSGNISIYDGEGAFLPSHFIHTVDLILGIGIVVILAINALRMCYFVIIKGSDFHIPWYLFIKKILLLPWHFFTQKRYADCDEEDRLVYTPWLAHLGIMLGYFAMLVIVIVALPQLQYGPEIDWSVHIPAYLSAFGLVVGTIYMIRSRIKQNHIQYKKTHSTDWMFIVLLFIIVITGVIQHVFHRVGMLEAANITYIVHLMAVIPWFFRMPFSKWAHMIYRPLAMYLAAVRREALVGHEVKLPAYYLSFK